MSGQLLTIQKEYLEQEKHGDKANNFNYKGKRRKNQEMKTMSFS
jgi:hypothetical protein